MSIWNSWEANKLSKDYQFLDATFNSECDIKPFATYQGDTGRCWIFAGLNCMRIPFIAEYDLLQSFEFSANFIFFWDKYERCKYFLETYKKINNPRVLYHFGKNPITDGGQWHMFVNIVKKYGIVPKESFKESYASMNSKHLNDTLNHIIKFAIVKNEDINDTLKKVYNILVEYLGNPPNQFIWNDNNESPISFYIKYIQPLYNVDDFVNIINDPRNEYNMHYTVPFLNNSTNDNGPIYYNLPMDDIIQYSTECIDNNIPLWFGSDISKFTSRMYGLSCVDMFDDPNQKLLSKKESLEMMDSGLTHAMVLRGYKGDNKKPSYWSIENSWGTTSGKYKGYYIADTKWFHSYVYQVVIPKKIANFKRNPRVKRLPPWDVFGGLAKL